MKTYLNFNSKGFSLMEVVISMMLVVLVMVPLMASVMQSAVFSKKVDMTYEAAHIAQGRIELLKGFDVDDLEEAAGEVNIGIDSDNDGTIDYRRTTTITDNYDDNDELVKVTVTVEKADIELSGDKGTMDDPVVMETVLFKGFEDD